MTPVPAAARGRGSRISPLVSMVIVIAILYLAREVLIPLALAALLSFLLAPAVKRLERWRLNRVSATAVVVLLSFSLIGGIAWVTAGQVVNLASRLPEYKDNIQHKLRALQPPSGGTWSRATDALKDLGREFEAGSQVSESGKAGRAPSPAGPAAGEESPPQPVVVVASTARPMERMGDLLEPLLAPLATTAAVIIFTVLMVLRREDLRDRLIRLIGQGQINTTTQALEDAARRVSRYLAMQLLINTAYGIPVGIALYFIGIPNAALWGLLAIVLRFIPYIGAWIAAAIPILLAFAISDGWELVAWTAGVYLALELLTNNVLEPWLYGASTGLSSIAVMAAAIFWTWLWGPIGLLLATPMTVILVVMGRYIPQLAYLSIVLGDEPVLTPETRYYQRLLAMDLEEAAELAEDYADAHGLPALFEEVLIPALILAEQDRHQGSLDEKHERFLFDGTRRILEEAAPRPAASEPARNSLPAEDLLGVQPTLDLGSSPAAPTPPKPVGAPVCVLPARDEADEIAGAMLAQLLERDLRRAELFPSKWLVGEMVDQVIEQGAAIVCISAIPPFAGTHARYLCKRLRAQCPDVKIVVGIWNAQGDLERTIARLRLAGADQVVTRPSEAVEQVRRLDPPAPPPTEPAAAPRPSTLALPQAQPG